MVKIGACGYDLTFLLQNVTPKGSDEMAAFEPLQTQADALRRKWQRNEPRSPARHVR